jgi:serine/threonine protein kinase
MNDKSRVRFDESVTKLDDDSRRHSTHTLFSPKSLHLSLSAAGHSEFDVCFEEDDESDRKKDDISTHKSDPDNTLDSLLEVQQVLYIQMEYLKNSTLRTLIDAHKLFNDPPNIWRIFHEVLCGLQYIHHQNMIHRDIKPMNILLDANWTAKIGMPSCILFLCK